MSKKRVNKLTKKQEVFCKEYVKLDDASAAYRIAYNTSRMKDSTINKCASELLRHPKIAPRIAELKKQVAEIAEKEFNIDAKEMLKHLDILRKARIDEYVEFKEIECPVVTTDDDGKKQISIITEMKLVFKSFEELTEEQKMCIESIKEGRYGIELKLHGKEWTIEKINKHIGFYEKDNEQKKDANVTVFELPNNGR